MSQAEELLNSVSEEVSVHTHPVPDTDTYFIIDPITRRIENTNRKKSVIMQYDHNSERFTFELPRFVDGHDMLECTSVTVNADNIEVVESYGVEEVEPRVNPDAPDITDLRIHPNDPEKVICSWLISRNSTQLAGILSFHIEFKCVDSNGNVVYEWSTDNYKEIEIRARKKNGEAAVAPHADLLEQWRTRIFGAGDSVMANIAAEGETQVAAVKAESETQQEAVELKGAQTLETIPEDYTKVDAMADEAVRSKGDAIVCEATGESIVLKDSSDDHIRGLKVFGKSSQKTATGKNLLDDSRFEEVNSQGVLVTRNSDGSFHASGTASTAYVSLVRLGQINLIAGERYRITGAVSNMRLTLRDETSGSAYVDDNGEGASYVPSTDMVAYLNIRVEIGDSINTTFYPMIRLASIEDDTWEPYTGGKPSPNPEYPQDIVSVENPTVRVYGKNLIPYPYPFSSPKTAAGVTFTVNEDGGISMSGTPTAYTGVQLCNKLVWNSDMAIALLGTYTNAVMDVNVFDVDGSSLAGYVSVKELILHKADFPRDFGVSIAIKRDVDGIEMTGTAYPIVIAGDILPTEYETYKVAKTLTVPRTLPGIPVTSGGNYTDENGQQWICDEIDFERGVYVQRCYEEELMFALQENLNRYRAALTYKANAECADGNGIPVLCDKYVFNPQTGSGTPIGNGIRVAATSPLHAIVYNNGDPVDSAVVLYPLETPIETPLTAEEITAFKVLRTNYPNTTVLNDAGAWVKMEYNADTKLYIENKITSAIDAYLAEHLN